MDTHDPIMQEFANRAIKPGGVEMFTTSLALEVVERCRALGLPILGIDAFFFSERGTQPSMEHSIDFSTQSEHTAGHGFWTEARQFS